MQEKRLFMYMVKGVECIKLFVIFMKIYKIAFILALQYALISRYIMPPYPCYFIYSLIGLTILL
jgi:hypothetical protein